jgi:hypothetical protein
MATSDQPAPGHLIAERTGQPLDGVADVLEAAAVAAGPVPAAELVTRASEVTHEITAEVACCTGEGHWIGLKKPQNLRGMLQIKLTWQEGWIAPATGRLLKLSMAEL